MTREGPAMKNQYVGDIGDYGKYGLLRYLSQNGIRTGVNWYLTQDDEIAIDGNIRGYLTNREESVYDSDVYALLRELEERNIRDIKKIESSDIIPHAIYYSEKLSTRAAAKAERKSKRGNKGGIPHGTHLE